MNITTEIKYLAIQEGIKTAGIGKRGSKPLSNELIDAILHELKEGVVPEIIIGAFFGSLLMKGLTEDEQRLNQAFKEPLLDDPIKLVDTIAPNAPEFIKKICVDLLNGKELDKQKAKQLGDFLLSELPGDGMRGMAASILRVRYETADEYEGLCLSLQNTIEKSFIEPIPVGHPLIQLAEPFDGVDQSNMITPLVADFLQKENYRVVNLVGRNSGPKFCYNLLDIANKINATFLTQSRQLSNQNPAFGWYLNQQDMSKPMDRWVDLRRQIIKRPFLATLERFVNPLKADILIASAFHAPYGDKMLTICERAGFPGAIIIRNGMEGTIAFPLKRSVKILCCARQMDGSYLRHEIEFNTENYLKVKVPIEEKLESPSLENNVNLIKTFKAQGKTTNELFDYRIKTTCAGLKLALEWLQVNSINNLEKRDA